MSNRDIEASWYYHDGTKHPGGYLLNYGHFFDSSRQPLPFKVYADLEPIPLPLDTTPGGASALDAIATTTEHAVEAQTPDIGALAQILYFSAGITKRINYPHFGEMSFRAAACTGALYHIELYVVSGDLSGLDAGVYQFDPREMALRRLRAGDHRRTLIEASANEPSTAHAPAILVYTDIFWRNACKYQAREYRHAFWDSGTILSHTLATASAHSLRASVVVGFVDETVNQLLDLDTQREVALALVPIGYAPSANAGLAPNAGPLSLETVPISDHELDFPAIRAMHEASSLTAMDEVAAWRGKAPTNARPKPGGKLFPLQPHPQDEMSQDPVESVILRRGSARQFSRAPISFRQLSTIVDRALQDIPADFLKPGGARFTQAYLIVNAIDGLSSGAYVFHRDYQALALLKEGNFRNEAGYLALSQELAADASVDIFFLADLSS